MADPTWPAPDRRAVLGHEQERLDGLAKSTARAKYPFDHVPAGAVFADVLRCPHAHARIRSIDVEPAKKVPGVLAVRVAQGAGSEVRWALDEIAFVAAETPEAASDGVRAIRVAYEVLPHVVHDDVEGNDGAETAEERTEGDPDAAFSRDDVVVSSGRYGLEAAAHCCLEPHGQSVDWSDGEEFQGWFSTQAVTSLVSQVAEALAIEPTRVRILAPNVGGGFGSKFSPDRWGIEAAHLSKEVGRPVHLFLDREAEIAVAGDRPSLRAEVELAATRDGDLVGWRSRSWGTGGVQGSNGPPLPYVVTPPNLRHEHVSVPTNRAPARAWRAPNHPQACLVTMAALDDLAAKLEMDPIDFLRRNAALLGPREATYREQLAIAERLSDWSSLWHPRGKATGRERRGLGVSLHTWGGRGHRSTCELLVHPDGTVEPRLGSQDIGTGTRTVIAMVAAETLGLEPEDIRVSIGDSKWPPSGPSGGSTTVGGVSASTRRAAEQARDEIFAAVAPKLGAEPGELEARDGRIRVAAEPDRSMPWKDAVGLVARVSPLSVTGRNPGPGELTGSGVGGVQVADVTVDVDTGVVRMNRMVAVQDCGLVVNPTTARSQVEGGLIMGISTALTEEKVHDGTTGRLLNGDMEMYRLATIGDVGELVVHLQQDDHHVTRGVIGLGEPPVISPIAAISNAVANAIGHRVGDVPLTPDRVIAVLEREGVEA